ncbi:hypothetical protein [Mycobacterium sp. NAZ190054]|uniref:hypothetical protein n=1 Tax=Mycobacterium sp. NAZ190054 TaxID=1747766 RepID=UPI000792BED6|nr:hypothetical protein [Mycobacterium sp. NAZ190054]KWX69194.1 hypothetical protein ASJ79_02320 [Mycobacterium sp. NAZ190054]
MTFTERLEQARTNIAEIFEVARIGVALQNREISAEQASDAIARLGAKPVSRDELELAAR